MSIDIETYLLLNLFGGLSVFLVYSILFFKDRKNRGYYVAPITWATTSFLFHFIRLFFTDLLTVQEYNTWAAINTLVSLILLFAVGLSFLWQKLFLERKKYDL